MAENSQEKNVPVVVLSTADYGAAVWTNKQFIASKLTAVTDVTYIESLGLRSPRLSLKDAKRVLRRLFGGSVLPLPRSGAASVRIVSPTVLPFHSNSLARWLNSKILDIFFWPRLPTEFDLWTFSPLTYGLEKRSRRTVYHSVDLLHEVAGIPRELFLSAERQLVRTADALVASSSGVAEHLIGLSGRPVLLWENVADVELFLKARSKLKEDRMVFAGNLTPAKVDLDLLITIADSGVRLAIAGPIGIDGQGADPRLKALLSRGNVEYLGVLSQPELAAAFGISRVGLIPYLINDYTAGVFPMKVYEYLAAGLNVVSTPLPSLSSAYVPGLYVGGREEFVEVALRLMDLPPSSGLRDGFGDHSWEHRLGQVSLLLGLRQSEGGDSN